MADHGSQTFIRGLLWSSFLLIPFLGKLKLFYENEAVVRITGRITHGTMTCLWADRIYMAGIVINYPVWPGRRNPVYMKTVQKTG